MGHDAIGIGRESLLQAFHFSLDPRRPLDRCGALLVVKQGAAFNFKSNGPSSRLIAGISLSASFLEYRSHHSWNVAVGYEGAAVRLECLKQPGFAQRLQRRRSDDHRPMISGQAHACELLAVQRLLGPRPDVEERISKSVGAHRSDDFDMFRTGGDVRLETLLHE